VTGESQVPSGQSASGRPKVIHVTTVDMSLDLLLRPQLVAFAEAGYEVVGASAPGPYVAELEAVGVRHVPLRHATRSMSPGRDLRFAREMYQLFRRERPDIVHTHTPKPGWFGRPAARAARVPAVVNTVHGLYATPDDPLARRAVVYGLERFAAAFSDAELLQSSEDVPVLRRLRVPDQRIAVLGNGIDLGRFSPPSSADRLAARAEIGLADDEVAVGVVGRLVWEKGLREVMAMAAELRRSRPGARVLVAGGVEPDKGDGLVEADLERVSAESGVVFLGERRPIERFYDALDVYVLASYREGFPRSAMEAAAQGLPLVVTDIRGCRQVVDPERNGLLVPVADPTSLTSAVTRLVDDPALRDRMGEASVAKAAADFDQRSVIDLTLATYRRLLAEGA
jgi:glycosyltransferase involved in cell wall biosynthesis